jgi:hypothetical protein
MKNRIIFREKSKPKSLLYKEKLIQLWNQAPVDLMIGNIFPKILILDGLRRKQTYNANLLYDGVILDPMRLTAIIDDTNFIEFVKEDESAKFYGLPVCPSLTYFAPRDNKHYKRAPRLYFLPRSH